MSQQTKSAEGYDSIYQTYESSSFPTYTPTPAAQTYQSSSVDASVPYPTAANYHGAPPSSNTNTNTNKAYQDDLLFAVVILVLGFVVFSPLLLLNLKFIRSNDSYLRIISYVSIGYLIFEVGLFVSIFFLYFIMFFAMNIAIRVPA